MKPSISKALVLTLCSASSAFAASGAEHDTGLFFWLFVGFAAMIIAFQFLPAITMFLGMVKGLFSTGTKELTVTTGARKR